MSQHKYNLNRAFQTIQSHPYTKNFIKAEKISLCEWIFEVSNCDEMIKVEFLSPENGEQHEI